MVQAEMHPHMCAYFVRVQIAHDSVLSFASTIKRALTCPVGRHLQVAPIKPHTFHSATPCGTTNDEDQMFLVLYAESPPRKKSVFVSAPISIRFGAHISDYRVTKVEPLSDTSGQ